MREWKAQMEVEMTAQMESKVEARVRDAMRVRGHKAEHRRREGRDQVEVAPDTGVVYGNIQEPEGNIFETDLDAGNTYYFWTVIDSTSERHIEGGWKPWLPVACLHGAPTASAEHYVGPQIPEWRSSGPMVPQC